MCQMEVSVPQDVRAHERAVPHTLRVIYALGGWAGKGAAGLG